MDEQRTDAETLKYQLKMAGFALSDVAESVGVSRSLVSKVIHRSRSSEPVQEFIAKQIGKSVGELFGTDKPKKENPDE
ncbi:regulatory protein, lacI family [Epibacterium ulvae]|uniref:Regulatory protein, lacI family n=1 Tax=Epibacterium ulvae TaxID=1156985 RepID=A0A1G5PPB8_9RHOB|nr:helix-turn-helix transcriptional regulator [Epibacterium ulvae]SCZ51277.1 regulatory protein, lacI family [Epibacterium ulvae]